MFRTFLFAVSLSAAAVAAAAPTAAHPGGCYTDEHGNCTSAPASLWTTDRSPVDRAAFGFTPDQHFAYFLTHDDDTPGFVITDFATVKSQGLWACQMAADGMEGLDAIYRLQSSGGYTFDQASAITSSAAVAYCP